MNSGDYVVELKTHYTIRAYGRGSPPAMGWGSALWNIDYLNKVH